MTRRMTWDEFKSSHHVKVYLNLKCKYGYPNGIATNPLQAKTNGRQEETVLKKCQKPGGRCIKLKTKTVCTHKDRNMHTHSFDQIYKTVHMPGSVSLISIIEELGTRARAAFPFPQWAINGCRCALNHFFVYWDLCRFHHSLDLSVWRMTGVMQRRSAVLWLCGIREVLQQHQNSRHYPWPLSMAVAIYGVHTTNSSPAPVHLHWRWYPNNHY